MKKMRILSAAIVMAVGALAAGGAHAQNYPSKPIRVIVPFAPGGSTDIVARLVTQRMSQELGQPMVVENKGEAGGAVGASEAARADKDGYTLSIATVSTMAVNAAVLAPQDPKVIEGLRLQGAAPSGNTPEAFAKEIKAQYDWAKDVVTKRNIALN